MKALSLFVGAALLMGAAQAQGDSMTKDLTPAWEFVADTVMGGVSQGGISRAQVAGRVATRLQGDVSLDNNGGFVQMAFDLEPGGGSHDASGYTGLELEVFGNGERYDLRLRTDQLTRPWHSFRTDFEASAEWTTLRVPFTAFEAHKTDKIFDPSRLRRIGVLAIGRVFRADVAISAIRLYR